MARKRVLLLLVAAFAIAGASVAVAQASTGGRSHGRDGDYGSGRGTRSATPIKHVVVIFQENVSFDHYFGTYPYAANTDGSPFQARPGTPTVNGLYDQLNAAGQPTGPLLTATPNGTNAEPVRLTIPGSDLPQVHYLRTLADSRALRMACSRRGAWSLVTKPTASGMTVPDSNAHVLNGIQSLLAGVPYVQFASTWHLQRAAERGLEIISEASRSIPEGINTSPRKG